MDHKRAEGADPARRPAGAPQAQGGGTQSIERALALLLQVGRTDGEGARLTDLVAASGLAKPTARRALGALVRTGLLEQDETSRRYHLGPESYVLGTLAARRFGIQAQAIDGLVRLAQASGDTAFLSVRRDVHVVCLHREEGPFPIRSHVLQAGDRHPLGIGAGSLAVLAALPDDEIGQAIAANAAIIAKRYPAYSPASLREAVARTRKDGYALNPGLLMAGSWGIGVVVRDPRGRPVYSVSLAAIESRLDAARRDELVPLLKAEAAKLERLLRGDVLDGTRRHALPACLAEQDFAAVGGAGYSSGPGQVPQCPPMCQGRRLVSLSALGRCFVDGVAILTRILDFPRITHPNLQSLTTHTAAPARRAVSLPHRSLRRFQGHTHPTSIVHE
ncbi:IclR family transcriptional regulator [Reyranella sp.]|uniref:IclR family transcriptional regulator n=1 Tax=Reyranella sp. TaxID=1929291 RepID=UPI0025FD1C12|nr:IclR family transcriptional regulator [Reyranella sp.]